MTGHTRRALLAGTATALAGLAGCANRVGSAPTATLDGLRAVNETATQVAVSVRLERAGERVYAATRTVPAAGSTPGTAGFDDHPTEARGVLVAETGPALERGTARLDLGTVPGDGVAVRVVVGTAADGTKTLEVAHTSTSRNQDQDQDRDRAQNVDRGPSLNPPRGRPSRT